MNRKSLSMLLALAMVISMFSVIGIVASAADPDPDYDQVWAIDVSGNSSGLKINDTAGNLRKIMQHSLGAPDAFDYNDVGGLRDNEAITALRYFDALTFGFGEPGGEAGPIVNTASYDLVLAEATVGAWHPEALEIWLNGATVDGVKLDEPYFIGVAFNNVGNSLIQYGHMAGRGIDGFSQECIMSGNYTLTQVWFPENVASADSVTLKDVTEEFATVEILGPTQYSGLKNSFVMPNGMWYKYATYTGARDGFDLDAVGAFQGGPTPSSDIAIYKFNDEDGDGLWGNEPALGGFTFQLLKWDADAADYLAIAPLDVDDDANADGISDKSIAVSADADGVVDFGDWGAGLYKIVELPFAGWLQTSYLGGVFVKVEGNNTYYYATEGGEALLGAAEVGNKKEIRYQPCTDSTVAGWVTAEDFPKKDGSKDDVYRTGNNAWFMAVKVTADNSPKTVDFVRGQLYDVGDVTFTDNGETVTVQITLPEEIAIMRSVGMGLYAAPGNAPNGEGQCPLKVSFATEPKGGVNTYTATLNKADAGLATAEAVYVYVHAQTSFAFAD